MNFTLTDGVIYAVAVKDDKDETCTFEGSVHCTGLTKYKILCMPEYVNNIYKLKCGDYIFLLNDKLTDDKLRGIDVQAKHDYSIPVLVMYSDIAAYHKV
jgi:hypothetical protein